jgi:hypothetical protein
MSVVAPLLAFLHFVHFVHFVHFEAKIMSAFSRETSVNTRGKSVNTRPSRNKHAFFSSSKHKESERA